MTTAERIEKGYQLADLSDRIESVYHQVLILKSAKDQALELYQCIGLEKIDKPIRIAETHLKRLEHRFDMLLYNLSKQNLYPIVTILN